MDFRVAVSKVTTILHSFFPLCYFIYTFSCAYIHMLHDSNFNSYKLIFHDVFNNRNIVLPLRYFQFSTTVIDTAVNIFFLFGLFSEGK